MPNLRENRNRTTHLKKTEKEFNASGHPLDLAEGRRIRSTTVICVRRGDRVVMAADGQVSLGATVMKGSAKKIRRLYNDKVLAGFAGSTADAFSLFSRFEAKLEQYAGNLGRSAVELAKDWRTDKMLRQVGSSADRGRPAPDADALGDGRRDRTGSISGWRRHHDHRLGRKLRPGRGQGADGEYRAERTRDCRKGHEDRREKSASTPTIKSPSKSSLRLRRPHERQRLRRTPDYEPASSASA